MDLTEEKMRENIDGLVRMGYDGVILTGGEPTLSPLLFHKSAPLVYLSYIQAKSGHL